MSKKPPELSIIIATFNSAKTLSLVLESVKKQTYPKSKIEILLVDGGSKDKTIFIGKKFGCKMVKNSRTEPVYGKFLGYKKAKGKYIMYLDHDEVLLNKKSLESRISALKSNLKAKAIAGGNYKSPKEYPFINDYINEFGDPFSFFIYRLSKRDGYFADAIKNNYPYKNKKGYVLADFYDVKNLPIIEQVAGGGVIDAHVFKKEFSQTLNDFRLLPNFFYMMVKKYPYLIIMKNDPILHYSSETYKKYFKKLIWRVKNNIFFKSSIGESGYSGRERYMSKIQRLKKYLFLPYALLFIPVAIDALMLSISRRNIKYLIHIYLVWYMAFIISYYYVKKLLGSKPLLRSYDESSVIMNKSGND